MVPVDQLEEEEVISAGQTCKMYSGIWRPDGNASSAKRLSIGADGMRHSADLGQGSARSLPIPEGVPPVGTADDFASWPRRRKSGDGDPAQSQQDALGQSVSGGQIKVALKKYYLQVGTACLCARKARSTRLSTRAAQATALHVTMSERAGPALA